MKLFTRTVGSGSRHAALVHGASMSGHAWRDLTPYLLEHDLTLTLVDQRGHGDSPRATSYRIEDFVGDLVETLPTGLDILMGQSLGGLTCAWASAELKPKRYIGVDPALRMKPFESWLVPVLGPIQTKFPDWIVRRTLPKTAPADTLQRVRAQWAKWDSSCLRDIKSSYEARPFPAAAPAVPSTIVLADPSFAVKPSFAQELRDAGWDVRVMSGGVHDLHIQDPRRLAEILSDVLEPVPAR